MAVTETGAPPAPAGAPGKKKGNWIEQHKAVAGLAAGGVLLLVVAHKGNKSGTVSTATDATGAAQAAAAEQAAIDSAVGQATGVASGGGSAGGGGLSDPGAGTSAPPSTDVPATTDPNQGGSQGGGGLTINVNTAAPTAKSAAKKKPPKKPPAKHGGPKPPTTSTGHGSKTQRPKPPAKQAMKKPTRPATHKPRHSVMMHGRTFDGAVSARTGIPQVGQDGIVHTPVVVGYGSHTEAHMSHNHGQAWTDNIPGMTPPSRGVPELRKATA